MPNPLGGSTIIGYLQKIRSGLVFTEGFENDNFILAEGWTTVQGVPVNSSNFYKSGIKSFQCTGTGATLAIIKKALTYTTKSTDVTCAECWFYDDGTTTAGTGPYFKVKTSAGKYFQVGVRNSISTGFYVCNSNASSAEDNFGTITTIARTVGWHKFSINLGYNNTTNTFIFVDGVSGVLNAVVATGETMSFVYVNSGTTADIAGTFGYFDAVSVYYSNRLNVLGNTSKQYNAYATTGDLAFLSQIGNPSQIAGQETLVFPYTLSFLLSMASPTTTMESVFNYRTFYPGDILSYSTIDFGRKVSLPNYVPTALKQVNQSPSGVVETIVTGLKDGLTFVITQLQGFQWVQASWNWFQAVLDGSQFSMMTDNLFDLSFGVISAMATSGTSVVTLKDNLSTNPTDSFHVNTITNGVYANNYFYVIRNSSNTKKQVVTVASKTNTTLTFNETLAFDVALLDSVYSEYLFPFLEIDGADLSGFTISDPNIPSYNWTQRVKEFNN